MYYFIILLIIATLAALAISYYAYRYTFYMPTKREEKLFPLPTGAKSKEEQEYMTSLVNGMIDVQWEEITITSFDGLKLHGRYFHTNDNAPLQIQFHGYKGSGLRDFCGGNLLARNSGFNTLLVTQRAHGKSEGGTISFGVLERRDCQSWIRYANERFGENTPIYLAGVSMGAATVLMASELDLPINIEGIIADCPYSSPKEIICKVCDDKRFPTRLVYPFIRLGAKLFGKFDLEECSAEEAVKHTKIPILLIHGDKDDFVPCEMSEKIFRACASPKRIEIFPGAGHAMSYVVDTERYGGVVAEFVKATCGENDSIDLQSKIK